MEIKIQMSIDRPKGGTMSLEETTISNMRKVAAMVEVSDRKGLCTKQSLHTSMNELRRQNPCATLPETGFPHPYLLAGT